jgi:hypothetical protein
MGGGMGESIPLACQIFAAEVSNFEQIDAW